jgi:hypothetical protein
MPTFRISSNAVTLSRVQFLSIDCAKNSGAALCKKFAIRAYPTIKLLRPKAPHMEIELELDVKGFIHLVEVNIPAYMRTALPKQVEKHDEL